MSKPSRLARPSKQSPGYKEPLGSRSHMLSVGERLMRAGSEGNLVRPRTPQQQQQQQSSVQGDAVKRGSHLSSEVGSSGVRLSCPDDDSSSRQQGSSTDDSDPNDPWSPRTVPRRHTVGGPRTANDVLTMQPHNVDRKREAFLEHLKQKYPHHASAIMGHQERLREQVRSPKHSPQCGVGDRGEHLSVNPLECLEVMTEEECPSSFTRGSRARASLPVVRSSNQTKDRSLGILYLQYGEDTKQIRMPNEITGTDTIRALFVSAFPQQLTMKMLESPSVAIYIKDDMRNMYYELNDVRNITPHSCLKVYHKDPAQAFNHSSRPSGGDARIHRDRLYATRDGQHPMRQPPNSPTPASTVHALQGSMSPPMARSMPSSPSRIPYGPRNGASMTGSITLPRERLSSAPPPSRSITPCPSSILERRDVKPDEDLGGSKSLTLYDPYALPEGRLSIASSQGSHPGDVVDGPFLQHRGSVKSPNSYAENTEQQHSIYRQKSRKYSESPMSPLGVKTPPLSPHRVNEVRMVDMPPQVALERSSSMRRSVRKDSNGGMEGVGRVRGNMASPVFVDLPPGHSDRSFQGPANPNDPHTSQRMKAMEQQIASLTGLVQHALFKGPNASAAKENSNEKSQRNASPADSGGVSPVPLPRNHLPMLDSPAISTRSSDTGLQSMLSTFRRNVSDLRLQLHQLRQMQLQNQDSIKLMLQEAGEELSGKMYEMLRNVDDLTQKQRSQVDEERQAYLAMEENLLIQLGDLEKYVEKLNRDSTSSSVQRPITLKDVEEGAVNLRKVGEALAGLKGEFPGLQAKMRAVLRVEVEAVRFLKEEPHKMDNMLKRVKALTETLSSLRRCATEGWQHTQEHTKVLPSKVTHVADGSDSSGSAPGSPSPTPQPRSPIVSNRMELTPSSPVVVQRVRSTPVTIPPCQHSTGLSHHPSPPLTPTHGRDSPTVAKVSPCSRESSPAMQKRASPRGTEELLPPTSSTTSSSGSPTHPINSEESHTVRVRSRGTTTEPQDPGRELEGAATPSLSQPDRAEDTENILQQTEASMMQVVPNLADTDKSEAPPVAQPDEVDAPLNMAAEPDPHPEAGAEKPVQASSERASKRAIEKPHRPSVDKARPGPEKASKSPPPPPPRRVYPPGAGLTTGRSGEVTNKKESVTEEEHEGEEKTSQPKALKVPPKVKPKPQSPPPCLALSSAEHTREDEGAKIMAELQVFEKSAVKDLDVRYVVDLSSSGSHVMEPSWSPISVRQTKTTGDQGEEINHPGNANVSAPQASGVIFYLTGQISSERLSGTAEDQKEEGKGALSPSKVAHENVSQTLVDCSAVESLTVGEYQAESFYTQEIRIPEHLEACQVRKEQIIHKDVAFQPVSDKRTSTKDLDLNHEVQTVNGFQRGHMSLEEQLGTDETEQVVMRSSRGRLRYTEDASLSPDLPDSEGPPPPPPTADNIAFMITHTKVQALSTGEYKELVSTKGGDVQTVKVGPDQTMSTTEECSIDRKPVIIIFDEPMDIRQAYKRLSTIFECEEELDRMLAEEKIDEESEEVEEEEERESRTCGQVNIKADVVNTHTESSHRHQEAPLERETPQTPSELSSAELDDDSKEDSSLCDAKQEAKRKFKFKFPKKQLAAIGQALRTGSKTGKKTLQVVVYEDEEDLDGTVKEFRETKRYEIKSSLPMEKSSPVTVRGASETHLSRNSRARTEEIRKNTYKTMDSLEKTIQQLETTISDLDTTSLSPWEASSRGGSNSKRSIPQSSQTEGSPSKRPATSVPKSHKGVSSQHKKAKPQVLPKPSAICCPSSSSSSSISSKKNASGSPSSSRMTSSSPKSCQQSGNPEKPGKTQKVQDSQRQFRQVVLL
ncbi:sickle tail protein homolog isoform X1 [Denticeps clupeoides]|uniref:sickle tail protein homolog isoform X1 n=3 Tax=Denticeps clupeoides TaxID=299321 RepID=UPI0010A48CDF|nr:sickle tail protein homolog isoform X1 [Denticeps clupeoides]